MKIIISFTFKLRHLIFNLLIKSSVYKSLKKLNSDNFKFCHLVLTEKLTKISSQLFGTHIDTDH